MSSVTWTVHSEDADATLGRFGSLGVAVLTAPLSERFFDRVGELMEKLAAEPRFSFLIVRAGDAPGQMPPALRDKAKGIMNAHASRLIGFGYVLGGSGLKAKLVRSAMNAVLLGASFPAKTFTDVPAATAWLLGQPGQPAELRAAERDIVAAIARASR